MNALLRALRDELDNGPDAKSPLPAACPLCGSDVEWQQIIAWHYYPDGNGYQIACTDPNCVNGGMWEVVEL